MLEFTIVSENGWFKVMRDRKNVRLRNCFCFRYQRLKNFLYIFLVPNKRMSMTVTTTWITRPRLIQSFTQQVTQIFSPVQQGNHKRMSRDGRIATGFDGHTSLRNIPEKSGVWNNQNFT